MMEKLSAEDFQKNYAAVLSRLEAAIARSGRSREDVTLLAATKTVDAESINYAIRSGITHIGENRVQEFLAKNPLVTEPVHRHFIGHLQTNKVKDIIDKVEMIESVSSLKLAQEISRQALRRGLTVDVLAEINIGGEESKSGFAVSEIRRAMEAMDELAGLRLRGLMAIPPVCADLEDTREYFKKMFQIFIDISSQKYDNSSMDVLSMGMSDDFELAIEEGATLVRVGSALFGKRIYK